jgi:hypothetical protein
VCVCVCVCVQEEIGIVDERDKMLPTLRRLMRYDDA